jgi:hypothetical protein
VIYVAYLMQCEQFAKLLLLLESRRWLATLDMYPTIYVATWLLKDRCTRVPTCLLPIQSHSPLPCLFHHVDLPSKMSKRPKQSFPTSETCSRLLSKNKNTTHPLPFIPYSRDSPIKASAAPPEQPGQA